MTIKKGISLALLVIGVVALGLVPRMGASESLLNLLILMFIYTMLATSWNILGGYTGQVNLGHAAFFGLGTLTARMLYTGGCPLPLAFLVAGVVPVVFSMLIGVPAFRLRLRGIISPSARWHSRRFSISPLGMCSPRLPISPWPTSRTTRFSLVITSSWP